MTLGNQDVWGSEEEIRRIIAAEGIAVAPHQSRSTRSATLRVLQRTHYVHARTVFEMLGFDEYVDLDKFGDDDPVATADLNEPLPRPFHARYDLVLDFGTMEHVFSVPTVLRSVTTAVKRGGWIIHSLPVPSIYWAQHGYYCFNPDMLLDFYAANGLTVDVCRIVYYPRPWFGTLGVNVYRRRACTFVYRRGMVLRYLIPADAMATFWLAVCRDREGEALSVPNQHKPKLGAQRSAAASVLRRLFFASQPFGGAPWRGVYRRYQGIPLSHI